MHKQANMICTGKKKGVFLPSEWKDPGTEFHLTWQGLHVHQPGQISEHHFHLLCNSKKGVKLAPPGSEGMERGEVAAGHS